MLRWGGREEKAGMELNKYIEHTLLKQDAVKADFEKLFKEAVENRFFGVCVNPEYVEMAAKRLKGTGVKVVTVVGFPLGATRVEVKAFEAAQAISDGADEVDMVINVTDLKNGEFDKIIAEISAIKCVCEDHVLKVILETDLLNGLEIKTACELCVKGGADFVKTSTGFVKGGVGAKVEDVKLMYETVAPHGLGVKASGGIKTRYSALALIEAGATRLGTSSGVAIVS